MKLSETITEIKASEARTTWIQWNASVIEERVRAEKEWSQSMSEGRREPTAWRIEMDGLTDWLNEESETMPWIQLISSNSTKRIDEIEWMKAVWTK